MKNLLMAGVIALMAVTCLPTTPQTDCLDENKINPDLICESTFEPVCGCDGITYLNVCEAEKAGLLTWIDGACENDPIDCIDESKIDPDGICITLWSPVCGCDGKTYGNECEAIKAGVLYWTDGVCN